MMLQTYWFSGSLYNLSMTKISTLIGLLNDMETRRKREQISKSKKQRTNAIQISWSWKFFSKNCGKGRYARKW